MAFPWPKAVVVEGPNAIAGYAPELELQQDGPHVVSWIEGSHRRAFPVQAIRQNEPDVFRFVDTRGREFALRPMTLELYEKHVKPHTIGKPSFASMDALLKAMRSEW